MCSLHIRVWCWFYSWCGLQDKKQSECQVGFGRWPIEERRRAAASNNQDCCRWCGPTAGTSAGWGIMANANNSHSPADQLHPMTSLQVSLLTLSWLSRCCVTCFVPLIGYWYLHLCAETVLSPSVRIAPCNEMSSKRLETNSRFFVLKCELVWLCQSNKTLFQEEKQRGKWAARPDIKTISIIGGRIATLRRKVVSAAPPLARTGIKAYYFNHIGKFVRHFKQHMVRCWTEYASISNTA